jgi:hypothetical protein
MSWFQVGVITQFPQGEKQVSYSILYHAIECIWALLTFYLYGKNPSHNNATVSKIDDALHRVLVFNNVFLLSRAGNMSKAKSNALGMELLKQRKDAE